MLNCTIFPSMVHTESKREREYSDEKWREKQNYSIFLKISHKYSYGIGNVMASLNSCWCVYVCVCESNGGRLNSLQAICVNLASGARKTTYALPLNSRGMVIARFRKNNLCCWICRFIFYSIRLVFGVASPKFLSPKTHFKYFK